MNSQDEQLLADLDSLKIDAETFLSRFSVDIEQQPDFVASEMKKAISTSDPTNIRKTLNLIWYSGDIGRYIDILNELLINPSHREHQRIAKELQDKAPSPSSVPFIRRVLESNFDYLEYSCSDSSTITKWFSWLLYSIRTPEAVALMKEFSNSSDEGIRNEMRYRLNKMDN
jgi:hypothetical protein